MAGVNAMTREAGGAVPKSGAKTWTPEPTRTGLSAETLQRAVLDNLAYVQGRYPEIASTTTGTWPLRTACATACSRAG